MLLAEELEFGDVVGTSGRERAGGWASLEIGDVGGKVAGFKSQLGSASLYVDGEGTVFTRRQRSVAGFEIEGDEDDSEGRGRFLAAGDLNRGRARVHVRGGQNGKISGGGGQDQAGEVGDGDVVGVGNTAEAVAGDFETVIERGDAGDEGNIQSGGRSFLGGEDCAGDAAGTPLDGSVEFLGVQRSDKESAAGGVGCELVTIGEFHGDAGSKAAVDVQHGEGGALATDKFAGKQEDARGGSRGRLLGGEDRSEREHKREEERNLPEEARRCRHNEIVVEIGSRQKATDGKDRRVKWPCPAGRFCPI